MKMMNRTLLFTGFWLLAALMERNALVTAASEADQYDARHGTPPPPMPPPSPRQAATVLRREATDHRQSHENVLELHAKPDRNHDNEQAKLSVIADADAASQPSATVAIKDRDHDLPTHTNELGEMQVGCGHGLFEVVPAPKSHPHAGRKAKKLRRKRATQRMNDRRRRNYHGTFTVWQPPVYQLTQPYIIPVWGIHGGQQLYFPPQPLHPDFLADPRKSYLPPNGYLPPLGSTTIGYEDDDYEDPPKIPAKVPLDNRNNFDDAPIWDVEPIQTRPVRPQTRPPSRTTQPPMRTRRPGVRTTTPPPLIHRSENDSSVNRNPLAGSNSRPNSLRPQQERPSPVDNFGIVPPSRSSDDSPTQNLRPTQPPRAQPSRCIWAIITCCQGNASNVNYSCFEQLGCTGAFWDKSPCDSDFAKAAVNIALQYYSQK